MTEFITNTLLEAVLTVVGILIAAAVSYFTPKIKRQLEIWADEDNLGIIEAVVDMAVELMEQEFQGESGQNKFEQAAEYVAMMANRYGIDVSDDFIKGAVQKGWRRMNDKQKGGK